MMTDETLNEAVRLTFEEMAFLDVAPGKASAPQTENEEGPVLYLEYTRPRAGALALFLPKQIKFAVAEAIYGETWSLLSANQLDDSLLELLNVLAGRILTLKFGSGTPYTMGLPTVLYDPPGELPGFTSQTLAFHVDSWELTLVWYEVAA